MLGACSRSTLQPYRVTDLDGGEVVVAVFDFLKDLQSRDLSVETLKQYGRALCGGGTASCGRRRAVGASGARGGPGFMLWLQGARKPVRLRLANAARPAADRDQAILALYVSIGCPRLRTARRDRRTPQHRAAAHRRLRKDTQSRTLSNRDCTWSAKWGNSHAEPGMK